MHKADDTNADEKGREREVKVKEMSNVYRVLDITNR